MKSLLMMACSILLTFYATLVLGETDIYDTGGPLMPEQAAFDITYYDLSLSVNPTDSSIYFLKRTGYQKYKFGQLQKLIFL
jgi:hypothetical protein